MKRKKTREELLKEFYVSKTEIADLFAIPYCRAKKVFRLAQEKDKAELKDRVIYDTKVRLNSALNVQGFTYNQIERQIKGAPER